ncbi:MAG: DEAD/DEAH box helicase [Fibrobacteraceae bacterium]|nr:DEAD/DEAH box helicase [Fibrobacteraceae bacterium]
MTLIPPFRFTPTLFAADSPTYSGEFIGNPLLALYDSALSERPSEDNATALFLFRLADLFFKKLSETEGLELSRETTEASPDKEDISSLLQSIPFAPGMEYVDSRWIQNIWAGLNQEFSKEIGNYSGTVALYLAEKSQHLKVAEKIFFHLVENKYDDEFPFAFLATYSTKDGNGKISHAPLKYALTEYKEDRTKILSLLSCLNKAGDVSPLINGFIESGEMFHPLKFTSAEAFEFLKSVPAIEDAGIVCRIPDWWKKSRQKPSLTVKLGENKKSILGLDSIIAMQGFLEVDGLILTKADIQCLLQATEGLAFIKGKWIEVDHERLRSLLKQMEKYNGDISLLEALRFNISTEQENDTFPHPSITNGEWLSQIMHGLRTQQGEISEVPKTLCATLRPYQLVGFKWLLQMDKFGFGACLADDMGLGKTVQVLTYLESIRAQKPSLKILLIVPASLTGNWQKECHKFVPEMDVTILHGESTNKLNNALKKGTAFLTITTYGMVGRLEPLKEIKWNALILDEAQAIKNPLSKQSKSIKELYADRRIAMTGTPIENDLSNLWSLFDFLDRGLLGSATEFKRFCKSLAGKPSGYSKLKEMISPFMLRRLKTDKLIIKDLPEKNETKDYVTLSKKQAALYKDLLDDLEQKLKHAEIDDDPMKRRGLVLSSLLHLKQICNHPDQFLGREEYAEEESGKFGMLRELCGTIYEKREQVIVFTQFREITSYLDAFLTEVFGCPGFVLHGGTKISARNKMVEEFQSDRYIPYMVLSVKAGGTGLNLTNANHVIHFDRWWNPAVENQATDRAFRIGQTKNVFVHKFVSRGTIEEKIDDLIESKKNLATNIVGEVSNEKWITEMSDKDLMHLLKLEA